MKNRAPKWRTTLTNSIHAEEVSPFEWHVRPGVEYAQAVEDGVKPGGKGLPRWADPEAADIKAWLTSKAFAGRKRARRNSMKAVHEDLELRDRYEGLAWHVRHFGVKAQPYMRPTVEIMGRIFAPRLEQAARNYMDARRDRMDWPAIHAVAQMQGLFQRRMAQLVADLLVIEREVLAEDGRIDAGRPRRRGR